MNPSAMTVVVYIALGLGVTSAHASPCSDEIAQLEKAVRQSESNPAAGPTASQSIGAQLRHQPTPESVRRAEVDSRAGLDAILTRAKALDAEGKTAECMELVGTAKLKLE
jgi:hypothetical protein